MKLISLKLLILLNAGAYGMQGQLPEKPKTVGQEIVTGIESLVKRLSFKKETDGIQINKQKNSPRSKKEKSSSENSIEDMRILMNPEEYNFSHLIQEVTGFKS